MKLFYIPMLGLAVVLGLGAEAFGSREATAAERASPESRNGLGSFTLINERNIFNSARLSRTARARGEQEKAARVDFLTLVGVISYEKGPFAFFDGSSADFQKVLAPGNTIAGYRVLEVNPESVKLDSGANTITLNIGMQLRREDDGDWKVAGESLPASPAASSSSASSADDATDIVKRMMQQREQELK